MAEAKVLSGAGLRGQIAGQTALCTVGKTGAGLTYRGYDVRDLAADCDFEEVAYLLFYGELPNTQQLADYKSGLRTMRELPQALKEVLERIPAGAHPMDVMRTGSSVLGTLEPELSFDQQREVAERLMAAFPAIMCYWYRFTHDGVRIDCISDEDTLGGHFLALLHGKKPSDLHVKVMNVSLILYAEHEFNASTFTARVCASTLSDLYSCVTGAIGSLRGPLHGGANEAAMDMIQQWKSPEEAREAILGMLERKDKIMGFGHAIYSESDPRNEVIKVWAKKLADEVGDTVLYPVSVAVDETMWEQKKLFPNADFYHASAYHFMGIPTKLFTPIFVCSRVTGWASHVFEQRSNNRIIRPSAEYIGPEQRKVAPIGQR
ncbi:2-methylcitrate synthase [Stutzerimonas zhaodongensis]|uniref:Citrate synthase n=1 Tax=Stutzerimonas zhaodongensis TaxID=1176257 RepID=A0A3M2HW69_9GAMM|nr:2-methylcitrate synthase [Stutzerimonas zhaodongensis]MCQ4314537.1 2-methylcitrate synthase [Stutzerimonas zhaodongensis]RMH92053.1 2-methylcitrate synthase [Stutzerimonas zhaodongensis]